MFQNLENNFLAPLFQKFLPIAVLQEFVVGRNQQSHKTAAFRIVASCGITVK